MTVSARWRIIRYLSNCPELHTLGEDERVSKLESGEPISQAIICIGHRTNLRLSRYATQKFIRDSTTGKECAKQNAFPRPEKNFSDGAWCMERLHDRPFQDFVAHETHRLIPPVRQRRSGVAVDLTGIN